MPVMWCMIFWLRRVQFAQAQTLPWNRVVCSASLKPKLCSLFSSLEVVRRALIRWTETQCLCLFVCLLVVLSPPQIKAKKKGNAPGSNSTAQDGVGVKAYFCNLTRSLHYYVLPKQVSTWFSWFCVFLTQLLFCLRDPDLHYHRVHWDIMITFSTGSFRVTATGDTAGRLAEVFSSEPL